MFFSEDSLIFGVLTRHLLVDDPGNFQLHHGVLDLLVSHLDHLVHCEFACRVVVSCAVCILAFYSYYCQVFITRNFVLH